MLRRGWPLLSNNDLHRRGIEPELEEDVVSAPVPSSTPAGAGQR